MTNKCYPLYSAGSLGADHSKFICPKCGLILTRHDNIYTQTMVADCPVCDSLDKEPTPKLTPQEIETRKGKIKYNIDTREYEKWFDVAPQKLSETVQYILDEHTKETASHPEECDCCICDDPELHKLRNCSNCSIKSNNQK